MARQTLAVMNDVRQRSASSCVAIWVRLPSWTMIATAWSLAGWCLAASADEPPLPPRPLRIACFNAENLAAPGERTTLTRFRFEPARRRHLEHVAAVIETLVPDMLVLSEVVSREGVEAVVELLHAKGLTDYRGYHVDGRDRFSGFDVAILARVEPDEIDGRHIHIFVPAGNKRAAAKEEAGKDEARKDDARKDESWMRRAYSHADDRGGTRNEEAVLQRHAVAYFTVHGRKIGLLGLHLKSNPTDVGSNAQRMAETAIARELVRREIVARGYTPIVLGDINDYDPDVPMADANQIGRAHV